MTIPKPSWDALLSLLGTLVGVLLLFRTFLPPTWSVPLSQGGTFLVMAIGVGLVLLVSVIEGVVRHKEASPLILSTMGVICIFLSQQLPTLILPILGSLSLMTATVLSFVMHRHSLDVPQAPRMDELIHDTV